MSFRFGTIKNARLGGLVGLIVALSSLLGCLIAGLFLVFPVAQARLSGVETRGVVTSISDCSDGGDVALRSIPLVDIVDNVSPTVQFTDRQGHRYVVDDGICGNYGIGEQVTLWYVPSSPTTYSLEGDTVTVTVLSSVIGFFGLFSLLYLLLIGGRFLLLAVAGARAAGQGNVSVYSPVPMGGQMGGVTMGGVNHRMGELVPIAGRWGITFTNAYPSQGTELVRAQPGRFFLLAQLSLRNTANEPLNVAQTAFKLFDAAGAEYHRTQGMEGSLPGFIQPGDQGQVALAYDVPGTLRQFRLSFYLSTSSLSQANWDFTV